MYKKYNRQKYISYPPTLTRASPISIKRNIRRSTRGLAGRKLILLAWRQNHFETRLIKSVPETENDLLQY